MSSASLHRSITPTSLGLTLEHGRYLVILLLITTVSSQSIIDARCRSPFGAFPDQTSCGRYISCWGGRGFSQSCGVGMVFNPLTGLCQAGTSCPGMTVGAPPSGQTLKLSHGRGPWSGQLMVVHQGAWALVDASSWNSFNSPLICQHLGFPGYVGDSRVIAQGGSRTPIVRFECQSGGRSLSNCRTTVCRHCTSAVISIRCEQWSWSRCPQRGGSWQRWGNSCYIPFPNMSATKGSAKHLCSAYGGNLVTIDSQGEHEFLSSLVASKDPHLEYFTDGMGMSLQGSSIWVWESTNRGLRYNRWWPGWNSTHIKTPPPLVSGSACLVLKASFPLSGSSSAQYDSGFYFFSSGNCDFSRPFICEAPLSEVGEVDQSLSSTTQQTLRSSSILRPVGEGLSVSSRSSSIGGPFTSSLSTSTFRSSSLNSFPVSSTLTTKSKIRCSRNHFECPFGGNCVSKNNVCDGSRDCPRGEDESGCKKYLQQLKKFAGQTLVIKDVKVINERIDVTICAKKCLDDFTCKGIIYQNIKKQCMLSRMNIGDSGLLASSREEFYEVPGRKRECLSTGFTCGNGKCGRSYERCDGKNDCGDNSDERDCSISTKYPIKLVSGKGKHEGNIQIQVSKEWGYICDDGFGWREADIICRDLGFRSAKRFTRNNQFTSKSTLSRRTPTKFWLDKVNCNGNENSIFECSSTGLGVHDCANSEIAGVECFIDGQLGCKEGEFECGGRGLFTCISRDQVCDGRKNCFDSSDEAPEMCDDVGATKLVRSSKTNFKGDAMGTVLVKHKGQWGTICDDNFDVNHAKVVCRNLGYEGGWAVPFPLDRFGGGIGNILIDDTKCSGNEQWLGECSGVNWGSSDCEHSEDAGVLCSDKTEVRLVGGDSRHQGRVEIKLSGVWGTVCDDDFDDYDAKVLCKMMGYRGGGIAHKSAAFGQGSGPIWLGALDCTGDENDILQCKKGTPTFSHCSHSEDAGVTCYVSPSRTGERALRGKLPGSCGLSIFSSNSFRSFGKIVGGTTREQRDSPWLVSLQLRESGNLKHNCGGVVISEDFVLTAAHCFKNHPKHSYIVRVGEYNMDHRESTQDDFLIEKLWVHDEFDTTVEFNNDIALIRIARRNGRGIRLGGDVQPVCLPTDETEYTGLRDCQITGWGTTSENAPPVAQRLPKTGKIHVYPMASCTKSGGYGTYEVTSGMVCAGRMDGKVDTCTGDSGGPMTCLENGKRVLYGITSWGKGCGRKKQPGMYTRITKFLRWLHMIIHHVT